MVYKPRLQLTCLTRRFGLGHKDGILSFLAQYLRNTSLSKHAFFVELEEALAHKWYKMCNIDNLITNNQTNVPLEVLKALLSGGTKK